MLKFVVRSGGNNSTEEQRVNVKKGNYRCANHRWHTM